MKNNIIFLFINLIGLGFAIDLTMRISKGAVGFGFQHSDRRYQRDCLSAAWDRGFWDLAYLEWLDSPCVWAIVFRRRTMEDGGIQNRLELTTARTQSISLRARLDIEHGQYRLKALLLRS